MTRTDSLRRLLPGLPTAPEDWRLVARTVRLVVSIPAYAAVAAVAAALSLTAFAAARNLAFAADLLVGPLSALPLRARASLWLELYPFVGTFFAPATGVVLVVLSALAGLDLAMVAYHLRHNGPTVREGSGGIVGVALGTLGAGCAACGSVLLAGVLSLFGAGGLVAFLPLEGLEVSLIAGVALLLSMYWIADGLRGGEVAGCPVDP